MKREIGVIEAENRIFIFYLLQKNGKIILKFDVSYDGLNFKPSSHTLSLQQENLQSLTHLYINKANGKYYLFFVLTHGKKPLAYCSASSDLLNWSKPLVITSIKEAGLIVPDYKYREYFVMYSGGKSLKLSISKNLTTWKIVKRSIIKEDMAEITASLSVDGIFNLKDGILTIYSFKNSKEIQARKSLYAVLFDKNDPRKILWRSEGPIWETPAQWKDSCSIGTVKFKNHIFGYWSTEENKIYAVSYDLPSYLTQPGISPFFNIVRRIKENPIIKPIHKHFWESKATFNAAAVYDNQKVHLIYRAIGDHDTSVLGYASSSNGMHIDHRSDKPIYVPTQAFEYPSSLGKHLNPYASGGGGYGGCEDPRITKIEKDEKLYITYVAHNGSGPPRVAISSISLKDFRRKKWSWKTPVLISPPNIIDKSACIFPEKINGKYAIMHRIFPNILIDFVDSLDFDGETFLKGEFIIKPRPNQWDSRKIGAGPPPIKTKDGWLLIYHAVDNLDPSRYKIGAMMLDLNDPTKVLYRSSAPIIEPTEHYDNQGLKWGVVYPCGAVIVNDNLFIYYGGSDMVTAVTVAPVKDFLEQLKNSSKNVALTVNQFINITN